VEEYSKVAKKVISFIILITILIYLALFFELPWMMCLFGILAQFVHVAIITNFPYVQFVSPSFLGALALLIANHYLAFLHFQEHYFPFSEVVPRPIHTVRWFF
jgi:Transmembrane adaptor Erv26